MALSYMSSRKPRQYTWPDKKDEVESRIYCDYCKIATDKIFSNNAKLWNRTHRITSRLNCINIY